MTLAGETTPGSGSNLRANPLPENTLQEYLSKVLPIVAETRTIITQALQKGFEYSLKPDGSFLTEVDLEVERTIRSRLSTLFPTHGILGEEFPQHSAPSEFHWTIDPIDGTHSFRHRIPLFGTIVALLHQSKPVLGIIDLPGLDRLYSGARGLGCWRNGQRLRLSDLTDESAIGKEILAIGDRKQFVQAGKSQVFDVLMQHHPSVRTYSDCFGHALAIEGAVGAMVDFDLRIWDTAASEILVTEAGGKYVCVRSEGKSDFEARYDVILGKPRVVDWVVQKLKDIPA